MQVVTQNEQGQRQKRKREMATGKMAEADPLIGEDLKGKGGHSPEEGQKPITKEEQDELSDLESTIAKNLFSFYEAGRALLRIRDGRLYRAQYHSFDAYCRQRWEMGRAYAYRLIESASVIKNLSPMGDIDPSRDPVHPEDGEGRGLFLPQNERQVRPLTQLTIPDQKEAWKRVLNMVPDGKITARDVARAVEELVGAEKEPEDREGDDPVGVEGASQKFKRAFERLLSEIRAAKEANWKTTSKDAALHSIEILRTEIAPA